MKEPQAPCPMPVDDSISDCSGVASDLIGMIKSAAASAASAASAAPSTSGETPEATGGGPGVFQKQHNQNQDYQQQAISNLDLHRKHRGRRSGSDDGGRSRNSSDSDSDYLEEYYGGCCVQLMPLCLKRWICSQNQYADDMSFSSRVSVNAPLKRNRSFIFTLLIIVFGMCASAGFLTLGILGAYNDLDGDFEQQAMEVVNSIVATIRDYEVSSLWIHESCRSSADHLESHHGSPRICSRNDFYELHQHLTQGGLRFSSAQYIPWIAHENRDEVESDSRAFYEHYFPSFNYRGITAFENGHQHQETQGPEMDHSSHEDEFSSGHSLSSVCMNGDDQGHIVPQTNQTFYLPIHYIAPIMGNEAGIDIDINSSGDRKKAFEKALETQLPTVTGRLKCLHNGNHDDDHGESHIIDHGHDVERHSHDGHGETSDREDDIGDFSYSVVLVHPGIKLSTSPFGEDSDWSGHHDHDDGEELSTNSTTEPETRRHRRAGALDEHFFSLPSNDTLSSHQISFAAIDFTIADLLWHSTRDRTGHLSIYIYDEIEPESDLGGGNGRTELKFLGGAHWKSFDKTNRRLRRLSHELQDLESSLVADNHDDGGKRLSNSGGRKYHHSVKVADRTWRVAILAPPGAFEASLLYVILGASFILIACLCVALWLDSTFRRVAKMNKLKAISEAEKAAIIIENTKQTARAERELNEFLAHEVRNPLAAAISASSFISAAVNESEPLITEESRVTVREDMQVIQSSLQFINDLLRSILDMHRASSRQMTIDYAPTDIRADVLEPVATMLYKRGDNYNVTIVCPPQLIIMADRLRLKQVVLNLASNARKFVQRGFIRLRAEVIPERSVVQISIEDSGPGIPYEKRKILFNKFQESLDSLSQGTGIGLSLCKHLSELMNGELWLDENYDSHVEGCLGSRFVVDLQAKPISLEDVMHAVDATESNSRNSKHGTVVETRTSVDNTGSTADSTASSLSTPSHHESAEKSAQSQNVLIGGSAPAGTAAPESLPEELKVLFTDDDFVLRKLFCRTIRRVAPTWHISEASNGETAIRMCETESFDLIFMDQIMASTQKNLLGTETVRAMRGAGVTSLICGLSANDAVDKFLKAGADSFILKPIPCEKTSLTKELLGVLNSRGQFQRQQESHFEKDTKRETQKLNTQAENNPEIPPEPQPSLFSIITPP